MEATPDLLAVAHLCSRDLSSDTPWAISWPRTLSSHLNPWVPHMQKESQSSQSSSASGDSK